MTLLLVIAPTAVIVVARLEPRVVATVLPLVAVRAEATAIFGAILIIGFRSCWIAGHIFGASEIRTAAGSSLIAERLDMRCIALLVIR